MVKFLEDGCFSTLPAKRIVKPPSASLNVGDQCTVKWSARKEYEAIVLAKGERSVKTTYTFTHTCAHVNLF